MEITARQYGRLEMAAWALAKHSEHNEVCTVLANGIMEVLDEIAAEDDLGELGREIPEICDVIGDGEREPDVPDWRDTEAAKQRDGAAQFAKDDKLTQIRLTVAAHQGESMAEIIGAILADGTDLKTLAAILGVNRARISEAKHGHARPGFKLIFTEVLGEGGAAGAKAANSRTGRTGRTNAGSKAEGK